MSAHYKVVDEDGEVWASDIPDSGVGRLFAKALYETGRACVLKRVDTNDLIYDPSEEEKRWYHITLN